MAGRWVVFQFSVSLMAVIAITSNCRANYAGVILGGGRMRSGGGSH